MGLGTASSVGIKPLAIGGGERSLESRVRAAVEGTLGWGWGSQGNGTLLFTAGIFPGVLSHLNKGDRHTACAILGEYQGS